MAEGTHTENNKGRIINDFRQHATDTGSSEVQIALITQRINELNGHLKVHAKDFSSRRGLMQLVTQRRSLLDYVRRHDVAKYESLLARLELRK